MRREHTGNAKTTTLNGSILAADTSFTATDGTGYPTGSVGPFVVTLGAGTTSEEKVLVTARTGNSFTGLTRGYDGTSAADHANGSSVQHTFSAIEADEANAHINATAAAHAASAISNTPAGNIAGTTVQAALNELDSEKLSSAQADALFLTPAEGNAAYVALSTIDAAGDLLVGSADNTVARLAKGSALQVLRVNAGGTALEYATPSSAAVTNPQFLGLVTPVSVDSTSALSSANMTYYMKFRVHADISVTALKFYVGAASGNMDVGIYADSAGSPAARLVSTGSFAVPAIGLVSKAISSTALTAGTDYWLAINVDNTTATFAIFNPTSPAALALADVVRQQGGALPLPATATPVANATNKFPLLYIAG